MSFMECGSIFITAYIRLCRYPEPGLLALKSQVPRKGGRRTPLSGVYVEKQACEVVNIDME